MIEEFAWLLAVGTFFVLLPLFASYPGVTEYTGTIFAVGNKRVVAFLCSPLQSVFLLFVRLCGSPFGVFQYEKNLQHYNSCGGAAFT